jgi:cyclic pyranopterin phosphate synthase
MPKEVFGRGYHFLEREKLLTFEETARLARILASLGVEKVRITGGEPLLRRELEGLIAMLAPIPRLDLTLTTNGSLLAEKAHALKEAGLRRVTVSLDSLDDEVFRAMNDVDFSVERVLAGIDAAARVGLTPIKINVVVIFATIHAELPIEPIDPNYRGEVASRWHYRDGGGEIGIIASVTQPFCRDCNRPGPRIADSAEILAKLLDPDRFPHRGVGAERWPGRVQDRASFSHRRTEPDVASGWRVRRCENDAAARVGQ